MDRLIFRSYVPINAELKKHCVPRASAEEIEKAIDYELAEAYARADQQDLYKLITPPKENADVKRTVAKRLEQLEKQTNKALAQLRTEATAEP